LRYFRDNAIIKNYSVLILLKYGNFKNFLGSLSSEIPKKEGSRPSHALSKARVGFADWAVE
jgi:hypothetical protein